MASCIGVSRRDSDEGVQVVTLQLFTELYDGIQERVLAYIRTSQVRTPNWRTLSGWNRMIQSISDNSSASEGPMFH